MTSLGWIKETYCSGKYLGGNATDEDTIIGPLVGQHQLEGLEKSVNDALQKGAKLVVGGQRATDLQGAYYLPTILTNITFDMQVWNTEIFGPVLPIVSFKTYDEAIKLANDTEYGLGGYVFTNDNDLYEKVASDINTGMICQNNLTYEIPTNPFGGIKNSGLGRENGEWGFYDMADVKIIAKQKR
ncbi:MAG: aldehyde dehydrogenase family protein [Candidatus Gracilibacteria bacterium]|nr:aldehyde dehydrogenase family protein [Candidatus Gracilibacteria bacterium]